MAKRINYAALPHIEYEPREGVIFGLALPLQLAPTLNMYAKLGQQTGSKWKLAAIHRALVGRIGRAGISTRRLWDMGCRYAIEGGSTVRSGYDTPKRRKVVVTRHSSGEPDGGIDINFDGEAERIFEPDHIGGKMVIDQLVKADVLVDDNHTWLQRLGYWVKAPPRKGKLVVEVFECEEPDR